MSCGHLFRVHVFAIGGLRVEGVPRGSTGLTFWLVGCGLDFESIDAVDALMVGLFSDFGGGAIRPRQTTKEIRLQRQGNGQK